VVGAPEAQGRPRVFTLGHSTRSLEELLALLREAGVRVLVDVRRFPASRRHPQFAREALSAALVAAGLRYEWLGETLGGRVRETLPPERSPNRAWTEPAFRRYADASAAPAFRAGLATLEALAREAPAAVVCAERLWWRCHRRILADWLLVRGFEVVHLLGPGEREVHALSEWARVADGVLTYPALV